MGLGTIVAGHPTSNATQRSQDLLLAFLALYITQRINQNGESVDCEPSYNAYPENIVDRGDQSMGFIRRTTSIYWWHWRPLLSSDGCDYLNPPYSS